MAALPNASGRPRGSRFLAAGIAVLLIAAAGLAACGSSDSSRFALAIIGRPGDPFEAGPELSLAGQLTRAATAEGLVSFDEQGRVVPALADRWIVTDDGRSYIFRLRDGAWRNGEPLSAKSAKAALDTAIRAARGSSLGLDLGGIDEVRTMAGRVVEIRLLRPMPYFLQILAQPELGLRRDKQGDGPMRLEHDRGTVNFIPIEPSRLGLPAVAGWDRRTRRIEMSSLSADEAVKKFDQGKVDLVLGGRVQDIPLTGNVGILRGTIQLDPVMGLFGLQVNRGDGLLAVAENREAVAMAIDRPALIAPLGVSGWTATTRLVPSTVNGDLGIIGERWQDLAMEQRRALASSRVKQWRSGKSDRQAVVTIWLPSGPGGDMLFDQLAQDMAAVGIVLRRSGSAKAADMALIDDVARYPRAGWFLNRLSCGARTGLCDAEADALVKAAVTVSDPPRRASMLTEAEEKLTRANVFIPFGSPIRWSLVRGNVDGFATNAWAWHPLMPLAWVHK